MLIAETTTRRFLPVYLAFLGSLVSEAERSAMSTAEWMVLGRDRFLADRSTLDAFAQAHPKVDPAMLAVIAGLQVGRFVYVKDTGSHSVLLQADLKAGVGAVGVLQRVKDLADGRPGMVAEFGLLALGGRWVVDGLVRAPVWLEAQHLSEMAVQYQLLRSSGRFSAKPA